MNILQEKKLDFFTSDKKKKNPMRQEIHPISFGALFRVYIMTHEVNMGVSSGVYKCRAEVD